MKVKITKESRKWMTVYELDYAKDIVEQMNDPCENVNDYARAMGVLAAHDNVVEVIKAEASISGNCRINNAYGEGTGRLDVWIDATVKSWDAFYEIGFYLTDCWALSVETSEEIRRQMYIKEYKLVKTA